MAPTCPLFPSVQKPLAVSLSLLPPYFLQQVEELSPPRMTSAAPAKKPYRKAPPEHRELRLESPGSRLEQEVSESDPPAPAGRCRSLRQGLAVLRGRLVPPVGVRVWCCWYPLGLSAAAMLVGGHAD